MSYATIELLIERHGEPMLVQLTDRGDVPTGAIAAQIVARAIADTDAVIDGYLAGRYSLPLSDTPPLLTDLALSICIYKLHPMEAPTRVDQDYRDALASLAKIAIGTIKLPIADAEPASSGAAGVEIVDRDRDFTPENMRGFI